jgi:membrane-associated phospholipid phosphatase
MKYFISSLLSNLVGCFKGRMIFWHLLAIVLTLILVTSGFDWRYFTWTRDPHFRSLAFPAIRVGTSAPVMLPLILLLLGYLARNARMWKFGLAIAQAVILGSLISSTYKAFTGRVHPLHTLGPDISHDFHFGFLRGGVFWGWPSSHTTIAFAMAATVFTLLPKQRWLGLLAIGYAIYVGLAVSVTIHWFSDFVAGTIIGTVIGVVVGKRFSGNEATTSPPGS